MKTIDWNRASELGLIFRINKEVLHPIGYAMTRNQETGTSESLIIADDGFYEYPQEEEPSDKEKLEMFRNEFATLIRKTGVLIWPCNDNDGVGVTLNKETIYMLGINYD